MVRGLRRPGRARPSATGTSGARSTRAGGSPGTVRRRRDLAPEPRRRPVLLRRVLGRHARPQLPQPARSAPRSSAWPRCGSSAASTGSGSTRPGTWSRTGAGAPGRPAGDARLLARVRGARADGQARRPPWWARTGPTRRSSRRTTARPRTVPGGDELPMNFDFPACRRDRPGGQRRATPTSSRRSSPRSSPCTRRAPTTRRSSPTTTMIRARDPARRQSPASSATPPRSS